MFGYYYHPRRASPGDVFASFFTFLILFSIFFFIAAYFGSIILMFFLGIGVLIGGVYAIVIYIKAFIDVCGMLRYVTGRNAFTTFLLKLWRLFKGSSLTSMRYNLSVAHSALIRSSGYRFLSFRKWMWFIVAPAVLIFGAFITVAVAGLQLIIFWAVLQILFGIAFYLFLIYLVIGFGYAIGMVLYLFTDGCSANSPLAALSFSRKFTFSDLNNFSGQFFSGLVGIIAGLWKDSIQLSGTNFALSKTYRILSIKKYFYLISPIAIMAMAILYIPVSFIIMSILFAVLFVVEFFWTILAKIIK